MKFFKWFEKDKDGQLTKNLLSALEAGAITKEEYLKIVLARADNELKDFIADKKNKKK